MRYIVKCMPDGSMATVQVIAVDVPHAVEAAQIMMDQGLRNIIVQDTVAGREAEVADFLATHGFEQIGRDDYA